MKTCTKDNMDGEETKENTHYEGIEKNTHLLHLWTKKRDNSIFIRANN